MTKRFILNFVFFQWFGYRRAGIIDDETGKEIKEVWVKMPPMKGWTIRR